MYTITNVGGTPGGEAFLLVTEEKAALIDSGFACSAGRMVANIKDILQDRPLDYVLLTHSHYDHASGSAYVQDAWPDARVAGSVYAKKILEKPSARAVIREMNDNAALLAGISEYEDRTDRLHIDIAVSEGDVIGLGTMKLRVIPAPGHTKCCTAFWCEEEKLLLSCETLGVPAGGGMVMPCYMVGYGLAMQSVERLAALGAEKILTPHRGLLEGEACTAFIENAVYWNKEFMRRAREGRRAGKNEAELAREFKELLYTPFMAEVQPEKAFDLNLGYTIPMLIREIDGE